MRYPSLARRTLEELKKTREWSLTDIAAMVDSDQPAIGRLLRGERQPSRILAAKIAEKLLIPVSDWDRPEPANGTTKGAA